MSKTICIVDDEPDILEILTALFKSKDYEIHTARNGAEGMELIEMVQPDLAILDLMMPGVSGLEMCKRLRASEKFKDLPILVLSAIARESDRPEEYWAAGLKSDEFVGKPFEPFNLLGKVEYLLRRKDYKSMTPSPSETPAPQPGAPPAAQASAMSAATPEEAVKTFIESWNESRFDAEYDCLGDEMLYGLSKDDYVSRRQLTYNETSGQNTIQHFKQTINLDQQGDTATLICSRENQKGQAVEKKKETYSLKQTPNGWKIIGVRIAKA